MAAILRTKRIVRTSADVAPYTESVVIPNAIAIQLVPSGNNAIKYKFRSSNTEGILKQNTPVQVANSDGITDIIEFTFYGASTVDVIWTDGVSGSSGSGDIVAALDTIIDILDGTLRSVLSGNLEVSEFVEYVVDGSTDICLSCAIYFEGSGGTLNGVTVKNGFVASYSGTFRNQVSPIAFTIPTIPDSSGLQRVLVGYMKI